MTWATLCGMATLCGIGFTTSLFISSLAFNQNVTQIIFDERFGIIMGSLLSSLVGAIILYIKLPEKDNGETINQQKTEDTLH